LFLRRNLFSKTTRIFAHGAGVKNDGLFSELRHDIFAKFSVFGLIQLLHTFDFARVNTHDTSKAMLAQIGCQAKESFVAWFDLSFGENVLLDSGATLY
jgi:hypothetical protein